LRHVSATRPFLFQTGHDKLEYTDSEVVAFCRGCKSPAVREGRPPLKTCRDKRKKEKFSLAYTASEKAASFIKRAISNYVISSEQVSDMQEQEGKRRKKKKFMFCEYSPKTISNIIRKAHIYIHIFTDYAWRLLLSIFFSYLIALKTTMKVHASERAFFPRYKSFSPFESFGG